MSGPMFYSKWVGPDGENPAPVRIHFVMHPVVDVEASRSAGQRVTKDVPHIHKRQRESKSDLMRPATADDQIAYPAEWQQFAAQMPKRKISVRAAVDA